MSRKLFVLGCFVSLWLQVSCGQKPPEEVVLYCAHDLEYVEPIIKEFEANTKIKVKMVTDTETAKTVGLVNKLIEETDHPIADVFWNNELSRTIILKSKGVLEMYQPQTASTIPPEYKDPAGYWTGFGARARVILYNTKLIKDKDAPKSIFDLTYRKYKGKVAIAKPLFGSAATHAAALFAVLGPAKAKEFYMKLKSNGCKVVAANSIAARMVMNGEISICFTDTDDANYALLNNKPVKIIYPDQDKKGIGTLVFPNSVMLVKGAPHPVNAKKLIDHIISAEVEQKLALSAAAQMPVRPNLTPYTPLFDLKTVKPMKVTADDISKYLDESAAFIDKEFLK